MSRQPDDQYSDHVAELYDHIPAYANRADIGFYLDLYKEAHDSILEVGCGTGRILIPAARESCRITGVDISEPMLEQCRERLAEEQETVRSYVDLVQADMRNFRLQRKFRLITMPFRVFQHLLSVDDQMSALKCIREHLEVGGRLIFDLFHPDLGKLAENNPDQEIEDTPVFDIGQGRTLRRTWRMTGQHPAEQYRDVELIYYATDATGKTNRYVQAFPMRYFFRYEVEHLLALSKFKLLALYGRFDKSPLVDDAPEMIFVAEKI